MAGNMIVIGSKFKPFSYDEMIKPIQVADVEHKALEDAYSELGAQSDLMASIANEQANPKAYSMYKSYADELANKAQELAKSGLTPNSRNALSNMRRRYSSEIAPIQIANTKREELTKEQREALQRDPSLLFDVNYATKNIDYMLDNPNATYTSISGNELTKRASQMASNFAKTIQNNPQYQSILGGQYFQQMQQMGYTPEQVISTILNDPNAPKELKQIADTVYEQAGLNKYDSDIQTRGRQFINAGLYDAIGTQKYDAMANRGYMSEAESRRLEPEEERLEMMKEQQEWAREEKKGYLMSDGTRVKPIGGGRVLITKPDGKWEIVAAPKASSTKEDTEQDLARPVIVDKASWGSGWGKAGYIGNDRTGMFNWFDTSRTTRDWGADYTLPKRDEVEMITLKDVDIEALDKIKDKVGSGFKGINYNFYRPINSSYGGLIAVPKNADPYQQSVTPIAPVQPAQQPKGVSFDPNAGL